MSGVRSIAPEHDGQLSGEPVLSLEIRFSACAGLKVTGLGFRICPPQQQCSPDTDLCGLYTNNNLLIL